MALFKVEISGVNTTQLPLLTNEEKTELFKEIKKGRNYNAVIARIYPKICLKQKIKNMIFVFRNSKKMS